MLIIRLPITSIVTVTARGIGEVKLNAGSTDDPTVTATIVTKLQAK